MATTPPNGEQKGYMMMTDLEVRFTTNFWKRFKGKVLDLLHFRSLP